MKLLVLTICILFSAQSAADSDVLPPPRKDLAALHWPNVTTLEEGVREQILSAQTALAAAAKNPATTDAALSEAYGQMGQIYHAYSLWALARDCYFNAWRLARKDFRWIYLLGKSHQQLGNFADALANFQIAHEMRPDYTAALINTGNILLELDRSIEASINFKAALALEENNPAAHYALGQIAVSKRDYSEAVKHFEQTLAELPGATRVHYSLAMAYRGLGNIEKARAHLAQQGTVGVRVADPLFDGLQNLIAGERVFLARGKLAFEAQRYGDAVVEFRKAVAAKPDSVAGRINLGAALTQTGDLNGAAEQFRAAIRIEPEKGNAHYNLAVILARQNRHDEAIVHLEAALKADPNDVAARNLLAQELLKRNVAPQ